METKVIKQEAAFVLNASDYNQTYEDVPVSWQELRNAEIGTEWDSQYPNCGRSAYQETAKLVYKDDKGAAVLLRADMSTDSPDPEWSDEQKLIWFAFDWV